MKKQKQKQKFDGRKKKKKKSDHNSSGKFTGKYDFSGTTSSSGIGAGKKPRYRTMKAMLDAHVITSGIDVLHVPHKGECLSVFLLTTNIKKNG